MQQDKIYNILILIKINQASKENTSHNEGRNYQ